MGLGPFHTITLADARIAATDCRKLLLRQIDPIEARDADKTRKALQDARSITFAECAAAYIRAHRSDWKNAKHADQWTNMIETYCGPIIGALPVQDVDTGLVVKVLEPIWTAKPETASRLRGRIESVLDWASERTNYPREVCEMALAHTVSDATEAAYRRGDLFDKRRRLMNEWAKHCDTIQKKGQVVALKRERA